MSRWIIRLLGILMLLIFMFIFMQMYKQLSGMQPQPRNTPATTTT